MKTNHVKMVVDEILNDLKVSILQYTAKSSRAISSVNVELASRRSRECFCLNHPLMMERETVHEMSDTKTQFCTADWVRGLDCIRIS